jgi:Ca-activated chloride channel homolog
MNPMRTACLVIAAVFLCGICGAQTEPASGAQATTAPASGQIQTANPNPEPRQAPDDNAPISKYVSIVNIKNLIFTATDKHGRFVKDLKQDQIKLLDNNRPPKEVLNFEAQTDLPLRVGLLIDASNSIRERFTFEQNAATEFLHQIIRPQSDQAFVMEFDEVADVTQEFTNDLDKLTAGINVIRPGGGTAMWDAVFYACRDRLMKDKNSTPVRRAIILVSDGDDNQSRVLRQEAIEMAQRAEVIVYAISTNLSNIHDSGDRNLQLLAEATGGRAFFPFKLQDLADAFTDIQGELRSQYSITYKPEDFTPNGAYRPIQIVSENRKLKIRASKGYYAPKR